MRVKVSSRTKARKVPGLFALTFALLLTLFLGTAFAVSSEGKETPSFVPGSEAKQGSWGDVVVSVSPGTQIGQIERSVRKIGGKVKLAVPEGGFLTVSLPNQLARKKLQSVQGVASLVTDPPVWAADDSAGDGLGELFIPPIFNRYLQTTPWGIDRIHAPEVWELSEWMSLRGEEVNVAIFDTGIDSGHPDLRDNLRGGFFALAKEGKYAKNPSYTDDNGHGTHVAGTVAALDNSFGVVGGAPEVNLYSVKVLGENGRGTLGAVAAGLYWAIATVEDADPDNDIRVVNMSLSAPSGLDELKEAIEKASASGILLVAAAGNERGAVRYPAKYPEVIAVSAINRSDELANFSNRGLEVELTAPGVDVRSTKKGGGYTEKNGTSMAAPHVTAAAALVVSAFPEIQSDELRDVLGLTAEDLGPTGWDQDFGYGAVDPLTAIEYLLEEGLPSEPGAAQALDLDWRVMAFIPGPWVDQADWVDLDWEDVEFRAQVKDAEGNPLTNQDVSASYPELKLTAYPLIGNESWNGDFAPDSLITDSEGYLYWSNSGSGFFDESGHWDQEAQAYFDYDRDHLIDEGEAASEVLSWWIINDTDEWGGEVG